MEDEYRSESKRSRRDLEKSSERDVEYNSNSNSKKKKKKKRSLTKSRDDEQLNEFLKSHGIDEKKEEIPGTRRINDENVKRYEMNQFKRIWTKNEIESIPFNLLQTHKDVQKLLRDIGYSKKNTTNVLKFFHEKRWDNLLLGNIGIGCVITIGCRQFVSKNLQIDFPKSEDSMIICLGIFWDYLKELKLKRALIYDVVFEDSKDLLPEKNPKIYLLPSHLRNSNKKWDPESTNDVVRRTKLLVSWFDLRIPDSGDRLTKDLLLQIFRDEGYEGVIQTLVYAFLSLKEQKTNYYDPYFYISHWDRENTEWIDKYFYAKIEKLSIEQQCTWIFCHIMNNMFSDYVNFDDQFKDLYFNIRDVSSEVRQEDPITTKYWRLSQNDSNNLGGDQNDDDDEFY